MRSVVAGHGKSSENAPAKLQLIGNHAPMQLDKKDRPVLQALQQDALEATGVAP